jgi:hypothetical protein
MNKTEAAARHVSRLLKTGAFIVFGFSGAAIHDANASVVTYPATPGMNMSGDYIVTADGQGVPVYRGEGPLPYSFAYFDFSGTAQVKVTSLVWPLTNLVVRPGSKRIVPAVDGNVMTFTVTRSPTQLSIEPNAKHGPLLLFANPIEQNPPIQGAPGVVYFGPGLHKPNLVILRDNQTLYLAGGAVLQAGVNVSGSNIKIRGRGIIDGLPWARGQGPQPEGGLYGMIYAHNATNVSIEGIILKDAWYSTVGLNRSSFVDVRNLKIVANRSDTVPDGFHNFNSARVVISDSFIRTDDDCIAPIVSWTPTPLTDGLTVTRSILWTDRANIWRIGSGFQKLGVPSPSMRNLSFTDIDVLHYDTSGNPAVRLMPNKDQALEHVRFENIRINHEGQGALVELQPWPATNGPIRNVYFKDIFVTGNFTGRYGAVVVSGPDAQDTVQDVTFENFVRHGELTLRSSPEVTIRGFTSNIVFIGSGSDDKIPPAVSVTAPVSGQTVSGRAFTVSGTASDNVAVAGVQFKLNGVNLAAEDPSAPYSIAWNSTVVSNGYHTLTAIAWDAAGNTATSAPVTIIVSNTFLGLLRDYAESALVSCPSLVGLLVALLGVAVYIVWWIARRFVRI